MDLLHLHDHNGDSISEKVRVVTTSPTRGKRVFSTARALSRAAHRIPVQWLFKTSYTRTTYPFTRYNKSSRSIRAATKNAFYHFNLPHTHLCMYKTLPGTTPSCESQLEESENKMKIRNVLFTTIGLTNREFRFPRVFIWHLTVPLYPG